MVESSSVATIALVTNSISIVQVQDKVIMIFVIILAVLYILLYSSILATKKAQS